MNFWETTYAAKRNMIKAATSSVDCPNCVLVIFIMDLFSPPDEDALPGRNIL